MRNKRCFKCRILKPIIDFHCRKNSKDGHRNVCKQCVKKFYYRYKYTDKYKKSALDLKLKKHYNITLEQYDRMFQQQNGVCAICGKPQPIKFHRLAVDHSHKTGKVRGLLCQSCNGMLGLAKDNIGVLLSAVKYLNI